jgi:enamine deaminase RidA (YjgF/YER057c/UK114 family)
VVQRIEATLKGLNLTLGDVVMMRVYLAGDPAKGGAMDFAGWQKAYAKFFGTKDQPNRPARSTFQVAALAAPGALVEVEVTAVRTKK